jgi:hypothetical protein
VAAWRDSGDAGGALAEDTPTVSIVSQFRLARASESARLESMQRRLADSCVASNSTTRETAVLCCHRSGLSGLSLVAAGDGGRHALRSSFLRRPGWTIFRQVLSGLRTHCPAAMPVVVRTSRLSGDTLGRCARRKSRFVIALNAAMTEHDAVETLIHEWAHALSWNLVLDHLSRQEAVAPQDFQDASHDEAWGCAYSRVWRVYIRRILPLLNQR